MVSTNIIYDKATEYQRYEDHKASISSVQTISNE